MAAKMAAKNGPKMAAKNGPKMGPKKGDKMAPAPTLLTGEWQSPWP